MTTPENTTAPAQPEQRKSKRRAVLAFGLAALAIGGIGAAATSAAWTDNVFFSAQAEAASFDLEGSLDGSAWVQSAVGTPEGSIQLKVADAEFDKLLPGQTRTVTLHVRNTGNTSAAITASAAWGTEDFADNPTLSVTPATTTLTTGSPSTTLTLTIEVPANWPTANQGASGVAIVTVAGEAVAP